MALTTISDGTRIIDNLNSTTPLDWLVVMANGIIVPEALWFSTSQLQLQLQIFITITTNEANNRSNTERFLNPTQRQIGHWALLTDNYVRDDGRIKYDRTAIIRESPLLQLGKTRHTAGRRFATTTNTKAGHAQLVAGFPICGTATGVGAVLANQSVSTARVANGTICMKVGLGAIEMAEVETFQPLGRQLVLNNSDYCLPDAIQGVLWGGYRAEIGWLLGYNDYDSDTVYNEAAPIVNGATIGADYQIQCVVGLPTPVGGSPLNILPPTFGYSASNTPRFVSQGGFAPDVDEN